MTETPSSAFSHEQSSSRQAAIRQTAIKQTIPPHSGIRWWLYGVAALVFAMVLVGGATRLTDSGLSITEWKPIIGMIPPLSAADWQDAFLKYQQIPEYSEVNQGMSLEEFKGIFWWEWGHRFLGRIIGFAFLLPFLGFLALGKIDRVLLPRLLSLFILGGLQGVLGWYMVKSGLTERVDVSQYRLAAHMGLAVAIFGAIYWVALGLRSRSAPQNQGVAGRGLLLTSGLLIALIYFQIILGAFVAGTHAGLSHNTWPLMDGQIIPRGLGVLDPWYLNVFENVLAIQFNHRMVAYAALLLGGVHLLQVWRSNAGAGRTALLVFVALIAQVALGIWTLLAAVPINLGIAHQAGALIVFALAVYHLRLLVDVRR